MSFDYSFAHWSTFFMAALLLNLSPGPDMAFILGQTVKKGMKSGFSAMFGIWTGAFVHVIFAALGLSAILATSAIAFSTIKWLGAAYLIWLGIQAIRSKGTVLDIDKNSSYKSIPELFKQGMFVAILNPKTSIFFLAFLPQFVEPGAGTASHQLFLHGILVIATAGLVEPPLIFMGGKLAGYISSNTRISRWMDRGLGALFIWLGVKLATSDKI